MSVGEDSIINSGYTSETQNCAVLLSTSRVFVIYVNNNINIYGAICSVDEGNIIIEKKTILLTLTSSTINTLSATALSSNKVFITYSKSTTEASYVLNAVTCTISDLNVTVGVNKQVIADTYNAEYIYTISLSSNKVCILHSNGGSYYLNGIVCTINGTTITVGTDTRLSSAIDSSRSISAVLLTDNRIFVANGSYYDSTTWQIYGMLISINGYTITVDTSSSIGSAKKQSSEYYHVSCSLLSDNRVFVAYGSYDSYGKAIILYVLICTINQNTITEGNRVELVSVNDGVPKSGDIEAVVTISDNKVIVVYNYYNNAYLYAAVCKIEGTKITKEQNIQLNSSTSKKNILLVKISKNSIFINFTQPSAYVRGLLLNIINAVQTISSSTDNIYGIVKDNATDGQQVDVYRPYEEVAV